MRDIYAFMYCLHNSWQGQKIRSIRSIADTLVDKSGREATFPVNFQYICAVILTHA